MTLVDLSLDRVETLISEISVGGRLSTIANGVGATTVVLILHPNSLDKLYADVEYKMAYEKAIEDGFLTIEETTELMKDRGIFTQKEEAEIADIENKIKAQHEVLKKTTKVPARRDKIKENIQTYKDRLYKILLRREEFLVYSAEKKAQEHKWFFLAWRSARNPHDSGLLWPDKASFDGEKDIVFRRSVFIEAIKLSQGMDSSIIRSLARSELWRIRYMTSVKTGVSLFGRELPDYTMDQLALAYWSQFYQAIYEMLPDERPPDSIIVDDAALDAFMESYMVEKNKEAVISREVKKKGSTNKSAWDHGETLVMRSNPIHSDLEYTETSARLKDKTLTNIRDKGTKLNK